MSKIFSIAMFVAGAAVGSIVTWKVLETKYERLVQEEIDSFKEVVVKKRMTDEEIANAEETVTKKPDLNAMAAKIATEQGYIDYSEAIAQKEEKKGGYEMNDRPYVISPDEFDEQDDYKTVSLTYYADGVITDTFDVDKILKEVDEIIGEESLEHFGEYEDDSVFVRNDTLKTDYEILKDERKYSEVKKPSQVDEE